MSSELTGMTARGVVELLKKRQVSPAELIDAALSRIRSVDGAVNALPILCEERARAHAARLGSAPERAANFLHGLPVAIKDSMEVEGVRSTFGSPIFADHVPTRSDLQVMRLEANGAIVLARSNAPEFAAGSNTFNEVFGKTRNPWNRRLSCGGSSGGAAVALATGEVWLANGTDLGGSLRIPASFCSVVGLRPSPGLVPLGPTANAFDGMGVAGPMARNVGDLALMLDAMTGFDPRDPLSVAPPPSPYLADALALRPPKRVAFSPDLGFLPLDREVRAVVEAAVEKLAGAGLVIEEACPDFRGANEIFETLRAQRFVASYAPLLERHRDRIKPDVIWNIEAGLEQDGAAVGRALRERVALYGRMVDFFETYDLLLTPAVIVPPFDIDQRYVEEVEGRRFPNYLGWLGMSYAITLTLCPALSLPAGFTASGLPIGLQLVGRPRGDGPLLAAAAWMEALFDVAGLTPIDPRL